MSQYYDLNNTGPQVQNRLDQTQENKQDIATLEEKVTAIENEIGESGQGGNTINARLDALETAVGSGGSVDERIAAAETEIIGGASSDYNTLGKVEGELEDTYRKNETYSKTELDNMITTPNVLYVTVIATSGTTDVTTLLPATGAADTVYRVGNWDGTLYDTTMYALYAWNGTAYICLAVRSFVGEVYDISVNHPDGQGNPTPYSDLAAALGTNGANIPADIRLGGMSIKFIQGTVQSSDNRYVQFRLMHPLDNASTTAADFANTANWQGVDEEPEKDSHNLVESGGVYSIASGKIIDIPSKWSEGEDVSCRMASAQYISMTGYICRVIQINGGETIFAKGNSNGNGGIVVAKSFTEANSWTSFDFATGETANHNVPKNNTTTFTCPSDARLLIVATIQDATDFTPSEMAINGVDVFTDKSSELSILIEKVEDLEEAVYPTNVAWCGDSEMNDVIEELYIPNASTVLGSGSWIQVLAITTGAITFVVKDSQGSDLVRLSKDFTGSIDSNPDGSYDYYFGRKGKAAITTIYKKGSGSLLQRIGYIKFKDATFAKTSTGDSILNMTNISNIDNSPTIKKMVNDGRQLVLSGDSHFGAFKNVNILQDLLQGLLGVQVYNIGFGGCRMAWREAGGANSYDVYTFCDVVDAIISGTFTNQEANVNLSADYPESVANLEAIDTSKPMQILVEYVVNDHTGGSPLGDIYEDDGTFDVSDASEVATKLASFDRTTLLGALNYGLLKLYANKPKSLWVQVTGGARVIDDPDAQGRRMRYNKQNSLGKTLDDYNKALSDDCNNIGIRYADYPNNGLYNSFAMRPGDQGITTGGSIHNNALGYSYMSKVIASMARYYFD